MCISKAKTTNKGESQTNNLLRSRHKHFPSTTFTALLVSQTQPYIYLEKAGYSLND